MKEPADHTLIHWTHFSPDRLLALRNQRDRELGKFAVSLILDGNLIGSGTFVSIDGRAGILTAHHVSEVFWKRGEEMGLNIVDFSHRLSLPLAHLDHHTIGQRNPSDEESGPDLSFVQILDPTILSTLHARMSFFRIGAKRFGDVANFPLTQGWWHLVGSPSERAQRNKDHLARELLEVDCLVAEADFSSLHECDGFDYLSLDLFAGQHNFPSNYGGVSGGGIWLVPLTAKREVTLESIEMGSPFLAGVAFHQSAHNENKRIIKGHGPISLEHNLVQTLTN